MLGRDADGSWTSKDRKLARALTEYEDSLCSSCGYPRHVCSDDENEEFFKISRSICYAKAAIDEETKTGEDGRAYKTDPGELLGVVLKK